MNSLRQRRRQQPRRRRYSPIQTTNDDTENSTNFSKQREQKNGTGATKKLKMMTDIDPGAACWNLTSQYGLCAEIISYLVYNTRDLANLRLISLNWNQKQDSYEIVIPIPTLSRSW